MNLVQREKHSLSSLCKLLGYSRQAFYKSIKSSQSELIMDELIIHEVINIRKTQPKIGSRKLFYLLGDFMKEHNIEMGRDAFVNVLRENRLLIRKRRSRKPITTFSNHPFRKYSNKIIGFIPIQPCQLWVSDITYIPVANGFCYLSLITDAYSRFIIGHSLSGYLDANSCVMALERALRTNPYCSGLILHSDRGLQYCSNKYIKLLNSMEIIISMTQNGDPLENALAERVNGILKSELLKNKYLNYEDALFGIDEAIMIYNYKRPHSSIDYLTPHEAHKLTGGGYLKRHWKNYYKSRKEVTIET